MQVGDLVIMPGSSYRDKSETEATGIILSTTPDPGALLHLARVKVYWIQDEEDAWEPREWLEVISESR